MDTAAAAVTAGNPRTSIPSTHTLDGLLALDAGTLGVLYAGATVPRLAAIAGDCRGRMLAVPALAPAVARAVRAFARSDAFPWRGKSFTPRDAAHGEGVNRVVSDRVKLYRFTTFVGPSRAGAFDAVQLDYDRPSNPFFIRAVKDELRELAPGLYLGQAYVRIAGKEHLALYFALEAPAQA